MPKPRLIVFTGAGASISGSAPSTGEITQHVLDNDLLIRRCQSIQSKSDLSAIPLDWLNERYYVFKSLFDILKNRFTCPNFEHILAALEALESFERSRDQATVNNYRSIFSAFVDQLVPSLAFISDLTMSTARDEFIKQVCMRTVEKVNSANAPETNMKDLFTALETKFELAIFTLNYDDLIERALESWYDGYTIVQQGYTRFNAIEFLNNHRTVSRLLCHLHGSVRFGQDHTPVTDELVCYPNSEKALASLTSSGTKKTVNGEIVRADNIISGVNKLSKLGFGLRPYSYYYRAFTDELIQTPRMLVVGYGGSDEHINVWLEEFVRIHQGQQKVAFITKRDGESIFERSPVTDLLNLFQPGPKFGESEIAYFENSTTPTSGEELWTYDRLAIACGGFPTSQTVMQGIMRFLN